MSDWLKRWNQALREQHKLLFDYGKKTFKEGYAQYTDCPICGQNDTFLQFEKDWFRWVRCKNCSMVYMNPRLTDTVTHQFYNSDANAIYNESKFGYLSNSITLEDRANIANLHFIDRHRQSAKGTLLEIGSGKGLFLKKAQELGYHVYGLELNNKNCLYSREFLGSETVLSVDLLEAKFPSEMFDVIYMRDLIQHIPTPKAFLMECRRIAKLGCTIFIGTHNIDGFVAKAVKSRYTPIFGFMEPCHFSPRTITKILKQTGFTVREIQFESLDCTIGEVISHFVSPTFTTIFPAEIGRAQYSALRLLLALLVRTPLRYLDNLVTPKITNWLKQGSWMNVLAEKNIP